MEITQQTNFFNYYEINYSDLFTLFINMNHLYKKMHKYFICTCYK